MNQRQIESFLAVAETGNFTRAAERLYISQPAVSKQVLSLEEELGFSLLIREYHKDVQLTEAGKLDLIFTIRDSIKGAEFERRSQSDCVHEQVAKADCECPFYWVKLAEMNRVLFYAEDLFEKMQKQSVNRTADSVNKAEGDIFAEPGNEDNRIVQDFRKITFFTVADGEYDSAELVREYLRPYGFEPKVQLVPNIEEAVARTYKRHGSDDH